MTVCPFGRKAMSVEIDTLPYLNFPSGYLLRKVLAPRPRCRYTKAPTNEAQTIGNKMEMMTEKMMMPCRSVYVVHIEEGDVYDSDSLKLQQRMLSKHTTNL